MNQTRRVGSNRWGRCPSLAAGAIAIVFCGCSESSPSGVNGDTRMAGATLDDMNALCSWADEKLATTRGSQCDISIKEPSTCGSELKAKAATDLACGQASVADLERCIEAMLGDPCFKDETRLRTACGAAAACIDGDGDDGNNQQVSTASGVYPGKTVAGFEERDFSDACEWIRREWSATAGQSCDISFATVDLCVARVKRRRDAQQAPCAGATIEQLETCTKSMAADACQSDLTQLNQRCGDAIDCLIPRGD